MRLVGPSSSSRAGYGCRQAVGCTTRQAPRSPARHRPLTWRGRAPHRWRSLQCPSAPQTCRCSPGLQAGAGQPRAGTQAAAVAPLQPTRAERTPVPPGSCPARRAVRTAAHGFQLGALGGLGGPHVHKLGWRLHGGGGDSGWVRTAHVGRGWRRTQRFGPARHRCPEAWLCMLRPPLGGPRRPLPPVRLTMWMKAIESAAGGRVAAVSRTHCTVSLPTQPLQAGAWGVWQGMQAGSALWPTAARHVQSHQPKP